MKFLLFLIYRKYFFFKKLKNKPKKNYQNFFYKNFYEEKNYPDLKKKNIFKIFIIFFISKFFYETFVRNYFLGINFIHKVSRITCQKYYDLFNQIFNGLIFLREMGKTFIRICFL